MESHPTNSTGGAKRLRSTATQRAEHLAAWKRSGLSATAYGRAHGVRAANLYAWSSKSTVTAASASPFVPVRISPGPSSVGETPRVVLRGPGLECVIEGAGKAENFASLAGALKRELFDV